jgi:hypothetical protein
MRTVNHLRWEILKFIPEGINPTQTKRKTEKKLAASEHVR